MLKDIIFHVRARFTLYIIMLFISFVSSNVMAMEIHIYSVISAEDFYRRVEFRERGAGYQDIREWINEYFKHFYEDSGHHVTVDGEETVRFSYRHSDAEFFTELFLTSPFKVRQVELPTLAFTNVIRHERKSLFPRRRLFQEQFYLEDFIGIFWLNFRNNLPEEMYQDFEKLEDIEKRFFDNLDVFSGMNLRKEFDQFQNEVFPDRDFYRLRDLLRLFQVFDNLHKFLINTRIYYHLRFDISPGRIETPYGRWEEEILTYEFTPFQCLFRPYEISVVYNP